MNNIFCLSEDIQWEDLGGGVSRKFLGWDNQIMMVKVRFEKGAEGSHHQHFHTQSTYCESGRFEFTVGDDKQIIKGGEGVGGIKSIRHDMRLSYWYHKPPSVDIFCIFPRFCLKIEKQRE